MQFRNYIFYKSKIQKRHSPFPIFAKYELIWQWWWCWCDIPAVPPCGLLVWIFANTMQLRILNQKQHKEEKLFRWAINTRLWPTNSCHKNIETFWTKTNSLGKCSWQSVPVKPGGLANTKFIAIMIQWISPLSILQWILSISWFWLRKVVNMRWLFFLSHILVLAPTQHFHPSHALPTQLFPPCSLEYPPPPFTDLEFPDHPVVQLRRNHLHKK